MSLRRPAIVGSVVAVLLATGVIVAVARGDRGSRPAKRVTALVPTTVAPEPPTTSSTAKPTSPPATTATTGPTSRPATDPARLAEQLNHVDAVLLDPAATPTDLAAAGSLQQLAVVALSLDGALRTAVAPRLTPGARSWFDATLQASDALTTIVPARSDMPPWRISPPQPAAQLLSYYLAAQDSSGIPWQYLAAIHLVETRMGRIHGNSTANAQGPMQFLPSTWARYGGGGDIQSDHDSIQAAARFLVANGGLTDMRAALRHYNQADSYVTAVTLYAKQMQVNERYYYGFYQWQVLYKHVSGRLILPAGYPDISPIPVTDAAGSFLAGP